MEIFEALVLFILFILIYMVIAEVFVVLFRITGIPEEMASFQVISMLTNSGFTTNESNIMINSKLRRRITKFVMLFGYAFTVTIVSALVNIFLQFKDTFLGSTFSVVPIMISIATIWGFLHKNKWIKSKIEKIINSIAYKFLYKTNINHIIILQRLKDLVIARVILNELPSELNGVELAKTAMKTKYGINVLYKITNNGESEADAHTVLNNGDTIVVIGDEKNINSVFGIKGENINRGDANGEN